MNIIVPFLQYGVICEREELTIATDPINTSSNLFDINDVEYKFSMPMKYSSTYVASWSPFVLMSVCTVIIIIIIIYIIMCLSVRTYALRHIMSRYASQLIIEKEKEKT